jgi:hypothetical protein
LKDFFASGHAVDLVLLVMALEVGWLLWRRRAGQAGRVTDLLLAFAPGVCLLLALRAALVGADWTWVALAVTASFPFHLLDLGRRLKAK